MSAVVLVATVVAKCAQAAFYVWLWFVWRRFVLPLLRAEHERRRKEFGR